MKIFNNKDEALVSHHEKSKIYLNSKCPKNDNLCGNHCALFYTHYNDNGLIRYIILGCKPNDKRLYVRKDDAEKFKNDKENINLQEHLTNEEEKEIENIENEINKLTNLVDEHYGKDHIFGEE